jgi:hypothetical protein
MAKIGFKYLCIAKMLTDPADSDPTYDTGRNIGGGISANLAVTNAEGSLYSDNQLKEYVSEFASGQFTADTDNIELPNQAYLLGADYVDGELRFSKSDKAPKLGFAGVQEVIVDDVHKWRAWFIKKCKCSHPDLSNTTRGNSISFGNEPIKANVMVPKYGPWYTTQEFSTEAGAMAYVQSKLNVATWFKVTVQLQGDNGATKTADFEGVTYVASGANFALAITGTPVALYDNGVERKANIASGVYTVSAAALEHAITVIF